VDVKDKKFSDYNVGGPRSPNAMYGIYCADYEKKRKIKLPLVKDL
jgi:hypothetical protein